MTGRDRHVVVRGEDRLSLLDLSTEEPPGLALVEDSSVCLTGLLFDDSLVCQAPDAVELIRWDEDDTLRRLGMHPLAPESHSVVALGGVVAVSDGFGGRLRLFEPGDGRDSPTQAGELRLHPSGATVAARLDDAWIALFYYTGFRGTAGLLVIDLSDASAPSIESELALPEVAARNLKPPYARLSVADEQVVVSTDGQMLAVDVTDPAAPQLMWSRSHEGRRTTSDVLRIDDRLVFVEGGPEGANLLQLDATASGPPRELLRARLPEFLRSASIIRWGDDLLVGGQESTALFVFDLAGPDGLTTKQRLPDIGPVTDMVVRGDLVYLTNEAGFVHGLAIGPDGRLSEVLRHRVPGSPLALDFSGSDLWLAAQDGGLQVYRSLGIR